MPGLRAGFPPPGADVMVVPSWGNAPGITLMSVRLTRWIVIALGLGIAVGLACREFLDIEAARGVGAALGVITELFLRLIRMIIAPLVLTTLVVGIANMGSSGAVGRVGLRALVWFLSASLVSLGLGLAMVNLLQPGVGVDFTLPSAEGSAVRGATLTLREFVTHLVPRSIIEAMAQNEILQIVVFACFVGVAAAAAGDSARPVVALADAGAQVMLKVTGYVMNTAPAAVFAAVAAAVATQGAGILVTFGRFMGGFYLSLLILWVLLMGAAFAVIGPRAIDLARRIRAPTLLAFSTASSEAAYPRTLEQLERFGASNRIASFVLPLGYSFNLDGSMMYCTFATIFIAQAYGIDLSPGQQITMLLVLMVTSKGMAGVPRASLVVIAATLSTFHIPEAGLLLVLGVDQFLDMGRSATNVVGNSVATVVVARWENELGPPLPDDAVPIPSRS
jgi:Na+/H+-dicarboxylate symporter